MWNLSSQLSTEVLITFLFSKISRYVSYHVPSLRYLVRVAYTYLYLLAYLYLRDSVDRIVL